MLQTVTAGRFASMDPGPVSSPRGVRRPSRALRCLAACIFAAALTAADRPAYGQVPPLDVSLSEGQPAPEPEHEAEAEGSVSQAAHGAAGPGTHSAGHHRPSMLAAVPFIILLLCIAILPLLPHVDHYWHKNEVKLAIAFVLAAVTLIYYYSRGHGLPHGAHTTETGMATVKAVLVHGVLDEYIPFIVLLFSLYTISGGIRLTGDLRATPLTNSCIIGIGALLASFIGTTGASMLLIRPLLQTNHERKHVRHTVIFFIFLVSNIGGSLLPIGDPPLFLGYLYGVPFLWTLNLVVPWIVCVAILLSVYYVWDTLRYRSERPEARYEDRTTVEPLRLTGGLNFLWLLGVILSVAFLVPDKQFLGLTVRPFMREAAQLLFVLIAWLATSAKVRKANEFNFSAIAEVAALFIGIFITMQAPIEYLKASSQTLQQVVKSPWQFFWMTGVLSSFLDNAPTYAVFFRMAESMTAPGAAGSIPTLQGAISQDWLVAISVGAVFMGANTYIGNGPNFMVKSIAEQNGVRMPSFFGYFFRYSIPILIPVFLIITLIFFRG